MNRELENNFVTLSLGSNFGDRERMILIAMKWLSENMTEFHASGIYETAAIGYSGNSYYNAVVSGIITKPLIDFEKDCKDFEISQGRNDEQRAREHVPIDIDVVTLGRHVLREWDFRQNHYRKGLGELLSSSLLPQYFEAL